MPLPMPRFFNSNPAAQVVFNQWAALPTDQDRILALEFALVNAAANPAVPQDPYFQSLVNLLNSSQGFDQTNGHLESSLYFNLRHDGFPGLAFRMQYKERARMPRIASAALVRYFHQFKYALTNLNQLPIFGSALVHFFERGATRPYTSIGFGGKGRNTCFGIHGDAPSNFSEVLWDCDRTQGQPILDDGDPNGALETRPSYIALGHEMIHAMHRILFGHVSVGCEEQMTVGLMWKATKHYWWRKDKRVVTDWREPEYDPAQPGRRFFAPADRYRLPNSHTIVDYPVVTENRLRAEADVQMRRFYAGETRAWMWDARINRDHSDWIRPNQA